GERRRLGELLAETAVAKAGRLHFQQGRVAEGFRWVEGRCIVLSAAELLHRSEARRSEPRRKHQSRAIDGFLDLREDDCIVHLSHGIGLFRGMKMLEKNGQLEEHLVLEFADQTLIYVPASKIDLIQKYVGGGKTAPRLSKIGGVAWERRKRGVQEAVADLAQDLIEIHATREAQPGVQYPPDSEWQREFETSFPYEETPDQLTAIGEIRRDMEGGRPMDRLLCGDVGFGKTELAMRAVFKAIDFGKQAAVLVPTTVLAEQHLRTFRGRMAAFPFVVEAVSRFQTRGEQREILKRVETGGVDVLIGTHRLLSEDVKFQDLGLLVIDEEQRFGVAHKEKLKRLRSQVDILTMSATPIPRTLHQSLLGIRDISNLETPPADRYAVETRIVKWDDALIRHAIQRELNRGGQVYFVHNRVHDIRSIEDRILRAGPEAKTA
ncbi:MAG: DEAD/DEAH box helicase, partial [Planctomycetia bacterium]